MLKEQEELHRNLGKCKNLSRLQQDSEDTNSLRALLEQGDMLKEALRKEKQCQKEIEKQVNYVFFSLYTLTLILLLFHVY